MTDLRALLANATPRPWAAINDPEDEEQAWIMTLPEGGLYVTPRPMGRYDEGMADGDAALIVALVNAADELVAVTEAAREWKQCYDSGRRLVPAIEALREAVSRLDARLAEENK